MTLQPSPTYTAAEEMLHLMLAHATGGEASDADYKKARHRLLSDPESADLVPSFVRTCRDPAAFWALIKTEFSGTGSYEARRKFLRAQFEPLLSAVEHFSESPVDPLVEEAAQTLSSASVTAAWQKASRRRARDPEGAITAARTLLESVCKTILDDAEVEYAPGSDLPTLYRGICGELRLAPSDYTERQFKQILGGCTSVVEGVGSIRNRHSDSHGVGRRSYRPAPRHAALAVNLAGSMALFLIETWEARQSDEPR